MLRLEIPISGIKERVGGSAAAVAVEYDEVQDMTVEIRPAADETGEKAFTLFGFAVSQN